MARAGPVISKVSPLGGDVRGGGEEESEGLKTECPCLCRCWMGQESRRAGGSRGWKRQDADSSLEPHRPILDFRPPPQL